MRYRGISLDHATIPSSKLVEEYEYGEEWELQPIASTQARQSYYYIEDFLNLPFEAFYSRSPKEWAGMGG